MTTYLIWTGIIYICLSIAMQSSRIEYVPAMGKKRYLPNKFMVLIICSILSGLYIFRWCNGTDFFNYYMDFYSSGKRGFSFVTEHRDILFALITYVTRNYISDNFLVYNTILAVITYVPVIVIMRKYSYNFKTTLLLYIFSTAYFHPYNTVRQGIAVAIMFASFPFLLEHQSKKFYLYSFVAFLFHPTSVIAACIMAFCCSGFLSKKIKVFILIFGVSGIGLKPIWNKFIGLLDAVGQTKMASDYADALSGGTGVNILYVVVAVIPLILVFLYKNYLLYTEDTLEGRFNSFYMNCLIFFFGFVTIGIYNPVFARMAQFFELFLLMLYPKLIEKVGGSSKGILSFMVLISYFAYFIIVLPRGGNYVPYQFNHYSINGIIMW